MPVSSCRFGYIFCMGGIGCFLRGPALTHLACAPGFHPSLVNERENKKGGKNKYFKVMVLNLATFFCKWQLPMCRDISNVTPRYIQWLNTQQDSPSAQSTVTPKAQE